MKKGSSAQEPELIVRHAGGYQFRYDIEQVQREVDGEIVTEWQYDHVNVPANSVTGDLGRFYHKTVRGRKMDALTVTTASGKIFDADEVSQTRMTRSLQTAALTGQTETPWGMADNTVQVVTVAEMQEALALAMQAQAALWFA